MSEHEEVAGAILRAMRQAGEDAPASVLAAAVVVRRVMPSEDEATVYSVADALYFQASREVVQ